MYSYLVRIPLVAKLSGCSSKLLSTLSVRSHSLAKENKQIFNPSFPDKTE